SAKPAGRQAPPLVAHAPFCLSTDAAAVREAARQQLAGYPRLPYYAQMMIDAGLPSAVEGKWTDDMVDAIVVHGDEQTVSRGLKAYLDAGAGEIIAAPIVIGDRQAALQRAGEFLGTLARS